MPTRLHSGNFDEFANTVIGMFDNQWLYQPSATHSDGLYRVTRKNKWSSRLNRNLKALQFETERTHWDISESVQGAREWAYTFTGNTLVLDCKIYDPDFSTPTTRRIVIVKGRRP